MKIKLYVLVGILGGFTGFTVGQYFTFSQWEGWAIIVVCAIAYNFLIAAVIREATNE